jgi:hypothetical protein
VCRYQQHRRGKSRRTVPCRVAFRFGAAAVKSTPTASRRSHWPSETAVVADSTAFVRRVWPLSLTSSSDGRARHELGTASRNRMAASSGGVAARPPVGRTRSVRLGTSDSLARPARGGIRVHAYNPRPKIDAGVFLPHAAGSREYVSIEQGTLRLTLDGHEYVLSAGDNDLFCFRIVVPAEPPFMAVWVLLEIEGVHPIRTAKNQKISQETRAHSRLNFD